MITTVLGSEGFIGSKIVKVLRERGNIPFCPSRGESLSGRNLGIVFYCIGLTADFRARPLETVDAHVCILNHFLRELDFSRLVYLSSTRVYEGLSGLVNENTDLVVNSNDLSDLYNISKLMGESTCLHCGRSTVIARLSNVVGPDFSSDNFLISLIRQACDNKLIRLRSTAESAKDYILLDDVVNAIIALGFHPKPKHIYNIASGKNLSNAQICKIIVETQNCNWEVVPGSPLLTFPNIDVSLARQDLGLDLNNVTDVLKDLLYQYQRKGA